jgi:hypothetical protein
MLKRACLSLALLWSMRLWSQAPPSTSGTVATQEDDTKMLTPPPVSGEGFPTAVGSEARSNYLDAGLVLDTAYDDNVLAGSGTHPVSDFAYKISPTIALDQTSFRQHRTFTYSPGFTFYQNTSTLDAVDQNISLNFQYRLSPHAAVSIRDSFQKSSNALNQPYPPLGGTISGSGPSSVDVIAPFADRLSNNANVEFTYQFSRDGMVGASGTLEQQDYPNPVQVPGLYNSNLRGGSTFYNHRLSRTQYTGVIYQYSRSQALPMTGESQTQTHTASSYYTVYLAHAFSLSVSGGPQYTSAIQSPSPTFHSWTPALTTSIGWQRSHTNLAASYSRAVTGAGGLLGVFNSNEVDATVRWQMARTWTVGSTVGYATSKSVSPLLPSSTPGGHTFSGAGLIQHSISERIRAEFGYARLDQSYDGIAVVSSAPHSDRVYVTVSYHFTRPLGR